MNGISGYSGGGRQMIEDYVAKGEDAPEFLPYGLTFQHKHVPELKRYAGLSHDPLMQPAVGNFAQGMITAVPLQLGDARHGADGRGASCGDRRPLCRARRQSSSRSRPTRSSSACRELDPEIYNDTNRMRCTSLPMTHGRRRC